jgi:peptidase M15-like protein
MSKPPISTWAAVILLALAGLVAANTTAQAARTSCLPGSVKAKLAQIRAKFGPVRIVSTHRPGARIAGSGKRSYHASCRAVDFHAPRGKYRQVVAWLKRSHSGGVGTYSCGMNHIHIDNGPRVRFHHCVNARGRPVGKKRRYAKRRSKKTYTKSRSRRRYAKKRTNTRRYNKSRSGKRYAKRYSKRRSARMAAPKRSRYASNGRRTVNKYAR